MNIIEEINLDNYKNVYVVGDIHGAFTELERVLYSIQFDKEKDLLVCVGDLVGRGNESNQAAKYLKQPWFKTVIGNHDLFFVKLEQGRSLMAQFDNVELEILQNKERFAEFKNAYKHVPLIIELYSENKKVIVSHANLPFNKGENYSDLKARLLNEGLSVKDLKTTTWCREIIRDFNFYHRDDVYLYDARISRPSFFDVDEKMHLYELHDRGEFNQIDDYLNQKYTMLGVDACFHGHNIIYQYGLHKNNALDALRLGNRFLIDTGGFYRSPNYYVQEKYNGLCLGLTVFNVKTMKPVHIPKEI